MFVVLTRASAVRSRPWDADDLGWSPVLGASDEGWPPPLAVVWPSQAPIWLASPPDELPYVPWRQEECWQPPAPWAIVPLTGPWLSDESLLQVPTLGVDEDGWLPPWPWVTDWRSWLPWTDEAVPTVAGPAGLVSEDWKLFRPWAFDGPILLGFVPDEGVPQPGLTFDEGWWLPVLWSAERSRLLWQDADSVFGIRDDTDAGMLPRPWPVLAIQSAWQDADVLPRPPFWLTPEEAWWAMWPWPQWWRHPHLVTEHVWEAWGPYVPPVIPQVPSSPLVSSEAVLVPGRWLGRTLVFLEATAATAGQDRLVMTAVVPGGTRILGVGYRCTTAFGTTGGLTAVDIGDATLQDRWGQAIGITVGAETGYGFGLGESVESLDAVDLWLSAVGGVFDAVGACTLNVVWERTAVP